MLFSFLAERKKHPRLLQLLPLQLQRPKPAAPLLLSLPHQHLLLHLHRPKDELVPASRMVQSQNLWISSDQGVPEHRIYETIFEGLVAIDLKRLLPSRRCRKLDHQR